MTYFIYFLLFILGGSVDSFLGVVISRGWRGAIFVDFGAAEGLPKIHKNRSHCSNCHKTLSPLELIPVFSYIFLLGKCLKCKSKIPFIFFLSEFFLGLWFVFSYIYFELDIFNPSLFDFLKFSLSIIFGATLTLLSLEDFNDKSVSANILYFLVALAILKNIIFLNPVFLFWSFLIASPFWIIYFVSRGKYIGLSDPYIFTSINIFFGPQFALSLFFYSVWFGTFFSFIYITFVLKKLARNIQIPFVPIIAFSTLFILMTQYHIIKISDILMLNEFFFK